MLLLKHLKLLIKYKGEKASCLEIRQFIPWYFKGVKNINEFKNKIYKTDNIHDIISVLNSLKENSL